MRGPARASPASGARSPSGALPLAELRAQLGRAPLEPSVPGVPPGDAAPARPLRRDRRASSTVAYLAAVRAAARRDWARIAANVVALLRHQRRQHRRQPPADLRRPRPRRRRPPPAPGPDRLRARPGPDDAARSRCSGTSRPDASRAVELAVLVLANAVATAVRFVLFRSWVFRPRPRRRSGDLGEPGMTATLTRPRRARHPFPPRPAPSGRGGNSPSSPCCWPAPACSTCGTWPRPAGPTPSTPRPCRPARRTGRRSSSARSDSGQRDHRRQAARLAVGDGALGPDLRLLVVEHARAAGADGRRRRGAALGDGPPGRGSRRRAARRRRARADAGRRADVPVQQPRRAAGAAHGRRRLGD